MNTSPMLMKMIFQCLKMKMLLLKWIMVKAMLSLVEFVQGCVFCMVYPAEGGGGGRKYKYMSGKK